MTDKPNENHFKDMDDYLNSISEIVKSYPETIESKNRQFIAIKKYLIVNPKGFLQQINPEIGIEAIYKAGGIVEIKCKRVIGVLEDVIDKPYLVKIRMFDND